MADSPTVFFLRDTRHGGDPAQATLVAQSLADFAAAATISLDVAIYDFRLTDPALTATVVDAFTAAAARGVAVRIGFDAGKPAAATADTFAALQADPAPPGTAEWVTDHFHGTGVTVEAIKAGGHLMHSKYVVRDASTTSTATASAAAGSPAVWTGSTNFTDDAWARQENNIIILPGDTVAADYRRDFDQMWTAATITGSGAHDAGSAPFGTVTLGWAFSPADGAAINTALADRITGATTRIIIAAMVLTSREVLAALVAALDRGIPVTGIYDGGQMDPIVRDDWEPNPHSATVLAHWRTIAAHLARKNSTPYTPTSVHDFMHLKVLITDDVLTTGSYNFSGNAERNAENQVHLDDPATVTAYTDYLTTVITAYNNP
jgi:phosphatidylserine/phosphatidylglycerophosphate/cardiolipin synthase-like enzyme